MQTLRKVVSTNPHMVHSLYTYSHPRNKLQIYILLRQMRILMILLLFIYSIRNLSKLSGLTQQYPFIVSYNFYGSGIQVGLC